MRVYTLSDMRSKKNCMYTRPQSEGVNLSLSSGTVPTEWKLANVVPLLKSGDPHDISNYRPISLCSTVGKILEKIVCRLIINHMYKGGIISDVQHGFFPKRSCVNIIPSLARNTR